MHSTEKRSATRDQTYNWRSIPGRVFRIREEYNVEQRRAYELLLNFIFMYSILSINSLLTRLLPSLFPDVVL